jgi:O-antigen/teichoic acid export membrane protein
MSASSHQLWNRTGGQPHLRKAPSNLRDLSPGRFRRLGKEFLWIGVGQAAVALGSLLALSCLTRALSPEAYGELALAMTGALLAQQVAMGPLSGAFLRFYAAAVDANQVADYLRAAKRLLGFATITLSAVGTVLVLSFCAAGQSRWIGLLVMALLFSQLSGYTTAMDAMQNAARQRAIVALHQGASQWLRFSLAVALIAWLGGSSCVAMGGFILASAAVILSQIVFFRRRILSSQPGLASTSEQDVTRWTHQMRDYAWPFALWGVFTWAQSSADRWALQVCGSPRDVGLYAALYQLGYSPMVLLSNFMVQLVAPVLFSNAGDGTDELRMAQSYRLHSLLMMASVLIVAVTVVGAYLFHSHLFSWFVAPRYREISPLLPLMALSSGLFALGQAASLSLLTGLDSKALLPAKITTALVGVLLSFVGASSLGVRGVVYASVAASFFFLAWVLFLIKRKRRSAPPAMKAPGPYFPTAALLCTEEN